MKLIKQGIFEIIPVHIVDLMTWDMLELRATGGKGVSIEKLKKITKYEVSHLLLTS